MGFYDFCIPLLSSRKSQLTLISFEILVQIYNFEQKLKNPERVLRIGLGSNLEMLGVNWAFWFEIHVFPHQGSFRSRRWYKTSLERSEGLLSCLVCCIVNTHLWYLFVASKFVFIRDSRFSFFWTPLTFS